MHGRVVIFKGQSYESITIVTMNQLQMYYHEDGQVPSKQVKLFNIDSNRTFFNNSWSVLLKNVPMFTIEQMLGRNCGFFYAQCVLSFAYLEQIKDTFGCFSWA